MAEESLPSPELLARLLCTVTETMWGFELEPAAPSNAAGCVPERAVALQLSGTPNFVVLVGWSGRDVAALQAVLGGINGGAPAEGDAADALLGDSVGEMVNILAGQVKSELALEHRLGLPKSVERLAQPVVEALTQTASLRLQTRGTGARLFVGAVATQNLEALARGLTGDADEGPLG